MTDEIQKHGGVAGDIDLVELVRGLWEEKWIVLIFSLLGILFAAIYAFLSTPVYEARIAILPPSLSDVAGFNQGRTRETGLGPFKVQDVSLFLFATCRLMELVIVFSMRPICLLWMKSFVRFRVMRSIKGSLIR